MAEAQEVDTEFNERADSYIDLANQQASVFGRAKVSASFMFALSRFNAWVSACGFEDSGQMQTSRQEAIDYFVAQYRSMLEQNIDDYIANFSKYMQSSNA